MCLDFLFRKGDLDVSLVFFVRCLLLGVGLAMDAFSISIVDGLNEPNMKKKKSIFISAIFGLFQGMMPFIGWLCVKTIVSYFNVLTNIVPFISLGLLCFIGLKMIVDGFKEEKIKEACVVGIVAIIFQATATSIDALSVGFTIANYDFIHALIASFIIALVTFIICLLGVFIGEKFSGRIKNKSTIVGGIILIVIGIEIFVTSMI